MNARKMRLARQPTSLSEIPLLPPPPFPAASATDHIAKLINEHPFPAAPLRPLLLRHLRPPLLSGHLIESLLARLFSGHAHGLKALELFRFSLHHPTFRPTPKSFDTTLHILTRMRDFDSAWTLIDDARRSQPSLLTSRSLSIILSRLARFRPFEDTVRAFDRAEDTWRQAGLEFGVDEFNALLRAFCSQSRVAEARAVFRMMHSRFPPNARILNTLLLGFKESGNVIALDLFYHETVIRGFVPDAVTYNIRIDAYCKKRRFSDALVLLEEMGKKNCLATVETMTTLVHGAGIARNPFLARRLFDEMPDRGLCPDRGAYNALIGSLVRSGDLKSGMELMEDMERKGIEVDDVTYNTLFCGLKRSGGSEDVCKLYRVMVERNFVPRTRTVMLLMKHFCEDRQSDLGLELWDYLVEKGCCPHQHALDLLVTGLCCSGKVAEAFRCFKQVVERGRLPSERGFRVLEGILTRYGETERLEELRQMTSRLQTHGDVQDIELSG